MMFSRSLFAILLHLHLKLVHFFLALMQQYSEQTKIKPFQTNNSDKKFIKTENWTPLKFYQMFIFLLVVKVFTYFVTMYNISCYSITK